MKIKRVDVLDYIKGISMSCIVLMHLLYTYGDSLPNIIRQSSLFLGTCSHIFIICSGFGLYYSFLNQPISYKDFYKKRLSNLYFPYIAIVLITACIPIIYTDIDKVQAVLSHVFLYKMFMPVYEESLGGQLWFISTIIQFYFVFFILVKFQNRYGNKHLMHGALLLSLYWSFIVITIGKADSRVWNSFFLQYLWEFVFGMVIANRYTYKRLHYKNYTNTRLLVLISFIGIGILGITGITNSILKQFNDIPGVLGVLALLILIYKMCNEKIRIIFFKLGKVSYYWFLVHILVFEIMTYYLRGVLSDYLLLPFMYIISLVIGILYYKLWTIISKKISIKKNKPKHTYNELIYSEF